MLPSDEQDDACLPYPLVSLSFAGDGAVRGLTSLLMLETAEPATCEVMYVGQTEPCYAEDATHLYALLGFSALMDSGEYQLQVRVRVEESEVAVDIPLDIEPGHYGFQRINPPEGLSGLMDGELMSGELEYLEYWRAVRSPVRMWQYPLDFPLPFNVSISAGYGDRRSYGGIVDGYHSGIDYRAWSGVPVLAPAEGVVILAEKLQVRGNAVLIDHGWGVVTGYWHLSKIDVRVGQHVERGQEFAYVGNTGLSTGSHLHFELWVNGVSVDGRQWLDAAGLGDVEFSAPTLPEPVVLSRKEMVE
ncbi:MAG: M23 family metallopeptidase [Anaerolineae bacterium]|nr:M23 family metallopeptidase [Anaerolineae bacterium]